MAQLGFELNTNDLPENENNFDPLPAGEYQVFVEKCDLCNTKDGTGQYLKLMYRVTSENFANRVVFGNLNIRNKSAEAERIGMQQMRSLLESVGISKIQDTDQLIGKNLLITVGVKNDPQYGDQNTIKKYKPLQNQPQQTTATTANNNSANKPPFLQR